MLDFCLQKIVVTSHFAGVDGFLGLLPLLDSSMILHDLRFPRLAGAIPRVRRQGEVHPGGEGKRSEPDQEFRGHRSQPRN